MKTLIRNLLFILFAVIGAIYIKKVYYDPRHLKAIAKQVRETVKSQPQQDSTAKSTTIAHDPK